MNSTFIPSDVRYVDMKALEIEAKELSEIENGNGNCTPSYYEKIFRGVKIDPYRICKQYNIGGGVREHIIKKLLRGTNKDFQSELELISELRKQLDRWEEMIKEDSE